MIKKFGFIAVIQLCNSFAVNILLVMLTSLIYKSHGNIAILMILMTIPTIMFSSFFGRIIDNKHSRKALLFLLIILIIITTFLLLKKLYQNNLLLYIFTFFVYSTDYLIKLYLQVSVTELTNYQHYLKFNSIINLIENIGIVVGPVLGGIWIQKGVLNFGFFLIGILFIFTLGSVFSLKEVYSSKTRDLNCRYQPCGSRTSINDTKNKLLIMYFMIGIFSFAIGLINVRQISFVITHYHVSEMGYSITESLWGLGMIIGCFVIAALDKKASTITLVSSHCFILGVAVIFLVVNQTYLLALVLFLILGIGNMIISIGFTTIIQKIADKNSMGKSLGMKNLWQQTAVLISMAFAGFFETSILSEAIYYLAGILLIVGGGIIFYIRKRWNRITKVF